MIYTDPSGLETTIEAYNNQKETEKRQSDAQQIKEIETKLAERKAEIEKNYGVGDWIGVGIGNLMGANPSDEEQRAWVLKNRERIWVDVHHDNGSYEEGYGYTGSYSNFIGDITDDLDWARYKLWEATDDCPYKSDGAAVPTKE